MIKVENGVVSIKGTAPMVLTDLAEVIRRINEILSEDIGDEAAHEMLNTAFEIGMKSDEELRAEHDRIMKLAIFIAEGRL